MESSVGTAGIEDNGNFADKRAAMTASSTQKRGHNERRSERRANVRMNSDHEVTTMMPGYLFYFIRFVGYRSILVGFTLDH